MLLEHNTTRIFSTFIEVNLSCYTSFYEVHSTVSCTVVNCYYQRAEARGSTNSMTQALSLGAGSALFITVLQLLARCLAYKLHFSSPSLNAVFIWGDGAVRVVFTVQ